MEKLKEQCRKIKDTLHGGAAWEFDGRFGAALIVLDAGGADAGKSALTDTFQNCYDSSTIKKASKQESRAAKALSGVGKGQLFFTSNEEDITLFGAWWPWGDNSRVSLRVGFFSLDEKVPGEETFARILKELFLQD